MEARRRQRKKNYKPKQTQGKCQHCSRTQNPRQNKSFTKTPCRKKLNLRFQTRKTTFGNNNTNNGDQGKPEYDPHEPYRLNLDG